MKRVPWLGLALAAVNLAVFAELGIMKHKQFVDTPRHQALEAESFDCIVLQRRVLTADEERFLDWARSECRLGDRPAWELWFLRLNAFPFAAAVLLIGGAKLAHIPNHVVLFYFSMPISITFWWMGVGSVASRWSRRILHRQNQVASSYLA